MANNADAIGHTIDEEDGYFWMAVEDCYAMIESLYVTYNTENKHQSYFLRLDDDGTGSMHAYYLDKEKGCNNRADCYRHDFTITSTEDQTVWLSLNSWAPRM